MEDISGGAAGLAHGGVAGVDAGLAERGEGVEHQFPGLAPGVARVEGVGGRPLDRRDGHLRGGEGGLQRVIQAEALEGILRAADDVEVAPHPAGDQVGIGGADLPEVTAREMRLVGIGIADGGQHTELAFAVQFGERRGERVPVKDGILGEDGPGFF